MWCVADECCLDENVVAFKNDVDRQLRGSIQPVRGEPGWERKGNCVTSTTNVGVQINRGMVCLYCCYCLAEWAKRTLC